MLPEALQNLASRLVCSKDEAPHIASSVRLWARGRRCAAAWLAHETLTRSAILAAAGDLRQRRTCVVLGSGLLRDVPLDDLARLFDTVVLVDRVHLASVRLHILARRLKNVRLVVRDLAGLEALLAGSPPEPLSFLRQVPWLDLVVSANLVSQIGTGIERRRQQPDSGLGPDAAAQAIRAQVEGLQRLSCPAVLITDTDYRVIDRTGRLHEDHDLMHGVALPEPLQRWDWPVVPFGEESSDWQVIHSVASFRF